MSAKWILLSVGLLFLWANNLLAQGYAGLGNKAEEGFSTVTPNSTISFPADHGPHSNFRIEWWYVTANLIDEDGKALGLQWTLFRNAVSPENTAIKGWKSKQFWLGHSAVTTQELHLSDELFSRGGVGQAGVQSAPFKAWIDDWSMKSDAPVKVDPFSSLSLNAMGNDFAYAVQLRTASPLIRHGQDGYSQKSDAGQASYYYSQPFYEVSGTVTIKGHIRKVSGKAWLDHEWSSQPLAADQTGWDWFSLHLDSGVKLMLFRLRQEDGRFFASGSRILPDGTVTQINSNDVSFTPLSYTEVAERKIPTSWQIQFIKENITLKASALNPQSWMDNSFGYWEGPVTISGDTEGVGYLEMTGY